MHHSMPDSCVLCFSHRCLRSLSDCQVIILSDTLPPYNPRADVYLIRRQPRKIGTKVRREHRYKEEVQNGVKNIRTITIARTSRGLIATNTLEVHGGLSYLNDVKKKAERIRYNQYIGHIDHIYDFVKWFDLVDLRKFSIWWRWTRLFKINRFNRLCIQLKLL
ncbi:hypothetical protein LX36DRAFT_719044 [Colletotrichum falcatum]|nr:hypothetical protein LX36DRAFT_719044 [Colletotrichum falcatum]